MSYLASPKVRSCSNRPLEQLPCRIFETTPSSSSSNEGALHQSDGTENQEERRRYHHRRSPFTYPNDSNQLYMYMYIYPL